MTLLFLISLLVIIGNLLGQIILIQSIPSFSIVKGSSLTIIKLYYGFYFYLLFNKPGGYRDLIKYILVKHKIVLFTQCFCNCLEKYIEKHPQKTVVCKKNIKYMSTPKMRQSVYSSTKRNLAYA